MMQQQTDSSAAGAVKAATSVAASVTAQAKQTPEMTLNTPVLFWGTSNATTGGRGITPNSFLKELETCQTLHGWSDEELLRYVQSCLRGEADLWWIGTICTYDNRP
jgi:hypothetical protein